MRTTLDIADDILLAVKATARREKRPIGVVVTDLVRRALAEPAAAAAPQVAESLARYGIRPLPPRGGVVTNEMIDDLRDGLA